MIKKLISKNFRTHENIELEFVPGINCIIGKPNTGKSNVAKAIELIRSNKPKGFRYHSTFSDPDSPTSITLHTDDGVVVFEKSKNEATYTVNDKVYRKFGTKVPPEVSEVLNIKDINVQRQKDPNFLVDSETSGGELSRIINKITKLDVLDTLRSQVKDDLKEEEKNKDIIEATIKDKKNKLKNFTKLPILQQKIKQLRSTIQKHIKIKKDIEYLKVQNYKLIALQEKLRRYDNLGIIKEELNKINDLEINFHTIEDNISLLNTFIGCSSIIVLTDKINSVNKSLARLETLNKKREAFNETVYLLENFAEQSNIFRTFALAKSKISTINNRFKLIESLTEKKKKLAATLPKLSEFANRKRILEEALKRYENTKTKLTELLKKNKVCWTCGSTLTEETINNIIRN